MKIDVCEINNEEANLNPKLTIKSHWNESRKIVLEFEKGKSVTVVAGELEKAIKNATNWRNY